jgi:hypothetical protein
MKITLKRTPDQVELVKAMASRNRNVAYEAQVALAEFIGPVLAEVLNQAPTLSNLFQSLQFDADDNPSIPLDLYYNISDEDYVNVWSQSHAGGLATNQVLPTASELKLATYSLDSAISFDRRYAAKSRLDVVSKTFSRVAQEILLKQERTSATLILTALANATTNGNSHAIETTQAQGRVILDDLNRLLTLAKRINTSWVGGTPTERTKGITDLIVSPEVVQDLRAMAYNPINTVEADGTVAGAQQGLTGPESMRDEIYRNAGIPTFYGLGIMEINELGVGQKFTTIYDTVASASSVSPQSGFDAADDLVLGIDRTRDSMIRAVAVDADSGSEFTLMADDQYSIRQNKIGYFGSVDEGRVVLDNRAIVGIQVNAA